MTTKCFRLITGEELLADVDNETKEFVQLKNPHVLAMVGEGQLGLAPWLPLSDERLVTIDTRHIIFSYVPKQDLVNHFKERCSGLVIANAGALRQLPKTPSNFGR